MIASLPISADISVGRHKTGKDFSLQANLRQLLKRDNRISLFELQGRVFSVYFKSGFLEVLRDTHAEIKRFFPLSAISR